MNRKATDLTGKSSSPDKKETGSTRTKCKLRLEPKTGFTVYLQLDQVPQGDQGLQENQLGPR